MNLPDLPFKPYPETTLAMKAAVKAGEEVLSVYKKDFSSTFKKDKEPLTEADLKSQEILLKELSVMKYPVISEESENMEGLNHDKTWIIDPLDGTSDFVSRTGEFSIMLGFVKDHVPIVGVVYQPTKDYLYIAQKGFGAYQKINDQWVKLSVNRIESFEKCRAIVSRHHLTEKEKIFLDSLGVSKFTQKGSCGLKVAEICQGNAELYFTTTDKIKQWDTCAAYCLIKESGGKMTDMSGKDLTYNTKVMNHQNGILVTNGKIHTQMVKKIQTNFRKIIS